MVNIHFIDNEVTLSVISAIMSAAGSNYNVPYDGSIQPTSGADRNKDDLLQYQLPGGATMQGYAEPGESKSMGSAINSLLGAIAPFISAYGLILPILGIIRGILEVICAMMNPFAVIKAVIRLFKKWIPPFISLFPPLAGIIIILSTIKLILAVVFFILTVLIPMIQLIIANVKTLASAFGPNGNKEQKNAGREKLLAMILEIMNQLGILAVLKPLLEIIFLILGLVSGFPCKKKKAKKKKFHLMKMDESAIDDGDDDTSCCDDNVCPEVFKKYPKGRALIIPSFFSDVPPHFAWRIITLTGNSRIKELKPYLQSLKPQLDAQLDEPVDEARSAGQSGDSAHFRIKLTGRRGGGQVKIAPLVKLSGNTVMAIDPTMQPLMGVVEYEIIPNWEILIGRNMVGLGCHPDVSNIINDMNSRYPDLTESVLDRFPELVPLKDDFDNMVNNLNNIINSVRNTIVDVVFESGEPKVPVYPIPSEEIPAVDIQAVDLGLVVDTEAKNPPYDQEIEQLESLQTSAISLLTEFANKLKNIMNRVLSKATDRINSEFDVDKNIVKAGGDKAIISVIPRDLTGMPLLKNLPDGVDISVSLFTDFGTILNQHEDRTIGSVIAEISSPLPGDALITAKVNTEYITRFDGATESIKEVKVKFVSDAIMPKRRFVSKPKPTSEKQSTIDKI